MRIILTLLLTLILLSSCHRHTGFNDFYREHKRDASFALNIPKWLVSIAIPKEERVMVKKLSRGMNNIRLLVNEGENNNMSKDFAALTSDPSYREYLYVKDDQTHITLFVREEKDKIYEIIFSLLDEEDQIIIALNGRMSREYFEKQLNQAIASE
jgi:hypothetical protein